MRRRVNPAVDWLPRPRRGDIPVAQPARRAQRRWHVMAPPTPGGIIRKLRLLWLFLDHGDRNVAAPWPPLWSRAPGHLKRFFTSLKPPAFSTLV